jgi:hypothetical protein
MLLTPAFRPFELEAIRLMADDVLSAGQLQVVREAEIASSYEYTGSGPQECDLRRHASRTDYRAVTWGARGKHRPGHATPRK